MTTLHGNFWPTGWPKLLGWFACIVLPHFRKWRMLQWNKLLVLQNIVIVIKIFIFENIHRFNFVKKKTQTRFAHNSATKYRCFVFKTNDRLSSITSYKDHCYSFFTSWVIKQNSMLNFINYENTHNFGHTVRTQETSIFRGAHCMKKTGFWNFEEIPFPWKLRAIRLSVKKGESEQKVMPGTGKCHIYM